MKNIILIILIFGAVINTFAQVSTKTLQEGKIFEEHPKFKISQKTASVKKMPNFDVAFMLAEDEAAKGTDIPFRFGKGLDVNYTLKDGEWENTIDGKVWSLTVQSDGAFSLNFVFSELYLSEGGKLFIF